MSVDRLAEIRERRNGEVVGGPRDNSQFGRICIVNFPIFLEGWPIPVLETDLLAAELGTQPGDMLSAEIGVFAHEPGNVQPTELGEPYRLNGASVIILEPWSVST